MILSFIILASIGAFMAVLGVLCSPLCHFRESSCSPLGASMLEVAKVYSKLSPEKGKLLIDNCQACNDNKTLYFELEERYQYQRPINIMVFQILIPAIIYLSIGVGKTDVFYHASFLIGYIASILICRLCFHLQVYEEAAKPRLSAPFPDSSDPDYFFDYWEEESYRSYDVTAFRKKSLDRMFEGSSSLQKLICFFSAIPILYGFLR